MFPGLAGPGTTLDSWLTLTPVWRGSCGGSQRQGPLRVNFFDKFPLLILTTKVLHCGKKGKRTQGVFDVTPPEFKTTGFGIIFADRVWLSADALP